MSTFQAAFLNEVIYVTNARFKESKEGCSLAGLKTKFLGQRRKGQINAFEGNTPTSIV